MARWSSLVALAALALLLTIGGAPAAANHAWGNYHWARTSNPFTVRLGDNVSSTWDSYLGAVSSDWSASLYGNPVRTSIVAGSTTGRKCRPTSGRVQVCDASYGNNGWLGLASIWISGSHITQGSVKLNDTYFNTGTYNTPSWRQSVACQEVGHTFGLDHQSEDPNVDLDTCMDYSRVPNLNPNRHDYEELATIYSHLDSTTTLSSSTTGTGRGKGLRRVRDSLYVEDLGGSAKRVVWVFWKNNKQHHSAPAEG